MLHFKVTVVGWEFLGRDYWTGILGTGFLCWVALHGLELSLVVGPGWTEVEQRTE
jgi:hypothetical protein